MAKRLNPNRFKIHRSYTVFEAAEIGGVHKRTVRNWIKDGLPVINDARPLLILGTDLKLFIREKRNGNKRKCKSSELYCFRCREPRKPASHTAKFVQEVGGIGRVFARCSVCDSKVNKYFSWRLLTTIQSQLLVENTVSIKTHRLECKGSPELYLQVEDHLREKI